jgi:hypothetical protein
MADRVMKANHRVAGAGLKGSSRNAPATPPWRTHQVGVDLMLIVTSTNHRHANSLRTLWAGHTIRNSSIHGRTFHTLTVPSQLAEASRCPSGLNATLKTQLVCPSSVSNFWPVAASHTLTVLS